MNENAKNNTEETNNVNNSVKLDKWKLTMKEALQKGCLVNYD